MSVSPFGLSAEQVRVLGALAEKAATTPGGYPLSTNGLRTACNQRSSRDPVVDYDEDTVKGALLALRERGLAKTIRGSGSRVFKHAHKLDETLELDGAQIAVLAVLALRGPQTVGELKTRTERQHRFESPEEVDRALQNLADRAEPLVAQLAREPGKKEARWRHLLDAEPFGTAPAASAAESAPLEPKPLASIPDQEPAGPPARPALLEEESAARAATLEEITKRIEALERNLREIKQRLDSP